ncbi:MAG TPA: carboxypeptidase regulatory-like domain-containing protein [Terriglobales bacterium]|nr:carboxypeptidase regulatory-like domain-containing protein [Terriglobales bacterium]
MGILYIFLAFVLLLVTSSLPVLAQTNRGGISGTVFDPQGAVVPEATVTVINVGTNEKHVTRTTNAGTYIVSNLDPVTYRVEVETPGFRKAIYEGVKVDTATTVTRNVNLLPGSVATVISVEAQAPLMNTESGTQSQTITARQMQDVPLFNRSVLDLALTAPNVSGTAGSEDADVTSGQPVPGFNININGGRSGSTTMLADGVDNTGVGIARAIVDFTPETVQEFSVQTSAYSAEYGQTGGGVINVTTKSGTNQYHGEALWYTRNPITNAEKWTAGSTRPPNNLRFNQFSGTLGGPVWIPKIYDGRNKTFFFFAGEPRYREDFLVVDTLLPTDAMRQGDFSNLVRTSSGWLPTDVAARFNLTSVGPSTIFQQFNLVNGQMKRISGSPVAFPGNVIPQSMMDPVALKALQFMPEPSDWHLDPNGRVKNYVVNRFVKQDEVRWTLRLDQNFSDKNKANFRYTYVPAVGTRGFGSDVNGNSAAYSWARQFVIADTHVITNRLMNDLRLNYTRGTFSEDYSPEFNIKTGQNISTQLGLPSLTKGGIPLLQFSSDSNGYDAFTNIGSSASTNNYNTEERYNIVDMVYWDRGAMRWKFGVDLTHALLNVAPFFGASGGRWDFRVLQTNSNPSSTSSSTGGNPFASYLLGIPNQIAVRPLLMNYYYRWNSAAAFIQNDWKVKPNLTLNLGVRYDLQLPRTEKNNLQGSFHPELAQSFPLSTPITIPGTTTTLTSFNVVPFQFAGHGSSKYIEPIDRWNFEPRFGFAWSPSMYHDRLVVHGGYGISHQSILGNNRLPNPDFGGFVNASTIASGGGSSGSVDPTSALRLSSNTEAVNPGLTPAQALNIPANGLVFLPSLGIPGYVIAPDTHIPYVQNWNLTFQQEIARNTVLELGYVGSKGTGLYTQLININPRDFSLVQQMENSVVFPGTTGTAVTPIGTESSLNDPLGRKDLLGNTIAVPWGSLASTYQGFNNLNEYFNSQASSIRHAGYISFTRRMKSLEATVNYTFSKSMDNASDASPDTRTLTTPTSSGGNASFGAPLSSDYSISTFDQPHWFTARYVWDMPFGRGRTFLSDAWAPIQAIVGGWTTSGLVRINSEYPFMPTLSDANGLNASLTHTVRPDINSSEPLINPLYNRNCVAVATCEPYVNPAAFMRPEKGTLGDGARVLAIRGPLQKFFDASIQKNFPFPGKWGADGTRRIQFRVDALNVFNHPNWQVSSGNAGPDWMAAPNEGTITLNTTTGVTTFTPISASEYDTWAKINSQPLSNTSSGKSQLSAIQQMINSQRGASGALPTTFWSVPIPQQFATTDPNKFDIRTLDGFKLYRLRQAYNTGFGQLRELQLPRYLQFGIRIFF